MMQKTPKIMIIGGGIGGAATALALHQAGFDVTVYERACELKEVGAGIALWANATYVLKKLDLLEAAMLVGNSISNYQFNSQNGKELFNVKVNQFDLPALGIHRADLHQLLWSKLPPEKLVLGQIFARFHQDGDKIQADFTSGLTANGDALIGADGLKSRVRALLLGDNPPIYRNFTTWRGLTDYIPSAYRSGYIREFFGLGKAFGLMMLGKNRMYWYAAAKAPEAQPDSPLGRTRELQAMFQDWFPTIPELIAATDEANILKTDLYDRIPQRPWSQQNITLLGDAAHPMLPTLGQGACMALEDAIAIAKCLQTQSNIASAFQQYESQRFSRTKSIVEQSLRSGKMGELANPYTVALRNTLMKLMGGAINNSFYAIHAYKV